MESSAKAEVTWELSELDVTNEVLLIVEVLLVKVVSLSVVVTDLVGVVVTRVVVETSFCYLKEKN